MAQIKELEKWVFLGIVVLIGIYLLVSLPLQPITFPPNNGNVPIPPAPLDTIPPTIAVTFDPEEPTAGSDVTITANVTDDTEVQSIEIAYNNGSGWNYANCSSSPCIAVVESVAVGVLDYGVNAVDSSGNARSFPSTGSASIVIEAAPLVNDTLPPQLSISHSPPSPHVGNNVTITAFFSDYSGVNEVEIFIDANSKKKCILNKSKVGTCAYSESFSQTGNHSYYATAIDSKGNTKQVEEASFTVQP